MRSYYKLLDSFTKIFEYLKINYKITLKKRLHLHSTLFLTKIFFAFSFFQTGFQQKELVNFTI